MSIFLLGISNGEDTIALANAVNEEIRRGGHVHPDSDKELQVAPVLPMELNVNQSLYRFVV